MKREKNKKRDKITWKEAFRLHVWAFRLVKERNRGLFLSSFCSAAARAVTPYAGIYLSARIINELAGARRPEMLGRLVVITLLVTAILSLLTSVLNRWHNSKSASYYHKLRRIYNDKMLDMDFCSLDDPHTHDLRSQIRQNEQWYGWGIVKITEYFDTGVDAVIRILGGIALTVGLFTMQVPETAGELAVLNHPLFAVGIVAVMLLVTFLSPACANRGNRYWAEAAESVIESNRFFSYFGCDAYARERSMDMRMYDQHPLSDYYFYKNGSFQIGSPIHRCMVGSMGIWRGASSAVSKVFTGIVYVFVCLKAWTGAFGVGSVTQYIGSITALSQGVSDLLKTLGDMKNNVTFLRTAYEFLDIPNDMYQGSLTTEKRSDRNYEVEFKDVSFKYPGREEWALRHVSMKFRVGQRRAVVGMNGSGKTTFIKLLCRLYDPTEGQILLNGIDIRKYRYDDYMSIFSVVFQDFQLLSAPLGQNVAAGQKYDEELVKECLEKAGFAERLARMEQGVETCLYREFDEQGVEVSGGEAQKIAIARALYQDAPFIILDEPTAALDPIAEAEIYTRFNEIAGDRTAIYISHRLSSCRFCDDIAVFDQGQVVEQGSHEELVAREGGKYQELWQAQAQYYTEKQSA